MARYPSPARRSASTGASGSTLDEAEVSSFPVKVREVIQLLEDDGWQLIRTKGRHRQFRRTAKLGTVSVAGKESIGVPPGTLNSILKQAGLKK